MRFVQKVACLFVALCILVIVRVQILGKTKKFCIISCQDLNQLAFTPRIEGRRSTYSVPNAIIQDGYNISLFPQMSVSSGGVHNQTNDTRTISEIKAQENITSQISSSTDLIVPNVVHYVLVGPNLNFTFINYLSFLSVERFLKPEQIFVHGDFIPTGHWWNLTLKQVKNIYHVERPYTRTAANGQPFNFPAHVSDYVRANVLLRYGGIYLDPDVLVLKSFDPLRNYSVVLGREVENGICNGIIIAQRGALFIQLILEQYGSYKGLNEGWADKSVLNLHTLGELYPHLVHVEETSLKRPNWREKALIYDGCYDWKDNYAMHMWVRTWPMNMRPAHPIDVINKSTTLGSVSRWILFGKRDSGCSGCSRMSRGVATLFNSLFTIGLAVRLLEHSCS